MGISLRTGQRRTLTVVGCIPLDVEPIGFGLPVLMDAADSKILAVQKIDELSGRVSGFLELETPNREIIHAPGPPVGIGDQQIYAFIDVTRNVALGTVATLRPILKAFAEANPTLAGVNLQISELIGTDQEKKAARARMRIVLLDRQGDESARSFYEGSVLRSVLWGRLLAMAANDDMSRRFIGVRSKLSAKINANGQIALDLAALTDEDRRAIDVPKLVAEMLLEFEPRPLSDQSNVLAVESKDPELQEHVQGVLSRIQKTGRQEERMALLLASILENPPVGKSALLQYQHDRAKMADWALKELRRLFIGTNWTSDEQTVAGIIPGLFTRQWPMTRGDLLYYLAKHLAKWPKVNDSIRNSLNRTHSMYVDEWRSEIEKALSQSVLPPPTTTQPVGRISEA